MIKVIICDDNELIIDEINNLIKEQSVAVEDYQFTSFCDGNSFLEYYTKKDAADIIFMDIEINDKNGIDLVSLIRKFDEDVIIIFVTSHSNYVSEAFKVGAFQYVSKPISSELLISEFNRAVEFVKKRKKVLEVRWNGASILINTGDLIYLENKNRSVRIVLESEVDKKCNGKMDWLADELAGYGFCRCHSSFILNIQYVVSIKSYIATMKNGDDISISKKYYRRVKDVFFEKISGVKI